MTSSLKVNLFQELLDLSIEQIQKEENKKKISTYIIEPSFTYIFDRLYPYIILTAIVFLLLLLLFMLLIFILIRHQQHNGIKFVDF
jgi:hypothetical protein